MVDRSDGKNTIGQTKMMTLCRVLTLLLGCVAVAAQEQATHWPPDFRLSVTRTREKDKIIYEMFVTDNSRNPITRLGSKKDFVDFVAKTKKGRWILWDSGCYYYDHLPLGNEKLPIQDAVAICGKAEVKFIHQFGF